MILTVDDLPLFVGIAESADEPYAGWDAGSGGAGTLWGNECQSEVYIYACKDVYRAWAGFAMWTGMADTEAK
jgi:hypothetical protein